MVFSCCAYNCSESRKKGSNISFHKFPQDIELARKWVLALRRYNFTPSQFTRICSKHFSPESYCTSGWSKQVALKPDAVPTIFDFPTHLLQNVRPRKPPAERTNTSEVTAVRFPRDEKLRKKWITAVNRKEWKPTEHSKLCKGHFKPETSGWRVPVKSKDDVVPSVFDRQNIKKARPKKRKKTSPVKKGGSPEKKGVSPIEKIVPVEMTVSVKEEVVPLVECSDLPTEEVVPLLEENRIQFTKNVAPLVEGNILSTTKVAPLEEESGPPAKGVSTLAEETVLPTKKVVRLLEENVLPTKKVVPRAGKSALKTKDVGTQVKGSTLQAKKVVPLVKRNFLPTQKVVPQVEESVPPTMIVVPLAEENILPIMTVDSLAEENVLPRKKIVKESGFRRFCRELREQKMGRPSRDEADEPQPKRRKKRQYYVGDFAGEGANKAIIAAAEAINKKNRQLKVHRTKCSRLIKKVETLNAMVKDLKEKLLTAETYWKPFQTVPEGNREFFEELLVGESHGNGKGYSPELKCFAFTLNLYSSKAYDFVRKTFNNSLPNRRTIQKWNKALSSKTALSMEEMETTELPTSNMEVLYQLDEENCEFVSAFEET